MFPPGVDEVCLQRTAWRAIVVKTGNTTVDLERWGIKKSTSKQRVQLRTFQWLASLCSSGGHNGVNSPHLIPEIGSRCRECSGGGFDKLGRDFACTEKA